MSGQAPLAAAVVAGRSAQPLRPLRRGAHQGAGTRDRLLDGALDELRRSGVEGLTVRGAARRAGLAPTTAYTYVSSKEHLVAEVFARLVSAIPDEAPDSDAPAGRRVVAALSPIAVAVAAEPQLARACTLSLLVDDPDVRRLRDQISHDWVRRVTTAVAGDATPEQVAVVVLAWSGMLLAAGIGHLGYADIPAQVSVAAEVVLGPTR